ncbi:MAG: acetyl-CoA carboxylase biotin carboxyl carrier protein [Verrucomicrobiota bacterium]
MELKQIKTIIDLMTKNQLSEFELEKEDFKIRIAKGGAASGPVITQQAAPVPVSSAVPGSESASSEAAPVAEGITINSPMVGTFYRSPSPDSPPFVDIGASVNEETSVCIIEAMKVMNEIKAELKGAVLEVLVENGKPVEFGQPLFRIKPSS